MTPGGADEVTIYYQRPPDREEIFRQRLVLDADDVKVTLAENMEFPAAKQIEGVTVLEPGSSVVWFTFPDCWHDIGRFHTADGLFTGIYANVLTPPVMDGSDWVTTDLYLDVWLPPGGPAVLLDQEELQEALREGMVDAEVAQRALTEATTIMELAATGDWPPPIVSEWTLERARSVRIQ